MRGLSFVGSSYFTRIRSKLRHMARWRQPPVSRDADRLRLDQTMHEALEEIRTLVRDQQQGLREHNSQVSSQIAEVATLLREIHANSREVVAVASDLRWKVTEAAKEATWRAIRSAAAPLDLVGSVSQVYSQTVEDSLIADIFARIGTRDRYFVEFGIEDGTENTTRWLLEQGWRGVWIEGSESSVKRAETIFAQPISEGRLTVVHGMVGPDNANELLEEAGVPLTFDYLSVDVDHNTAHVWSALRCRARVCCIEYNATLPVVCDIVVPFMPDHGWDGTNWFGASLKALERIGSAKGMALVGCDLAGVNAYFVANDEAKSHFSEPFTAESKYQPPRYYLVGNGGHPPSRTHRNWHVHSASDEN
jgi:hypothetical protein